MGTITEPLRETPEKKRNLVEMNWDPITRIVGSLGIFTKIDFENKQVAECHSTSSIFRGYSIFMKGKDPRDAHFITSRICGICGDNHATCACYAQNMAFGVRPPALGEWIVNLVAMGLLSTTLYQAFFLFGVKYAAASDDSLVIGVGPVLIAITGCHYERCRRFAVSCDIARIRAASTSRALGCPSKCRVLY